MLAVPSNNRGALTPSNLPVNRRAFLIDIPDSTEWFALISGAITELASSARWELFGAVSIDDAVETITRALVTARWEVNYIGQISAWINRDDKIPEGFLSCNGDGHLKADYPLLWEVMPDSMRDSTSFVTPNLSGRALVHEGAIAGGSRLFSRNVPVGVEATPVTNANMLSHSHTIAHTHGYSGAVGVYGVALSPGELPVLIAITPSPAVTGGSSAARSGNQGGGQPIDVIQPVWPTNYLIRAR